MKRRGADRLDRPRVRLLTSVLAAACVVSLGALVWVVLQWRLPGNDIGYAPRQPIEFSHRLHSTDLEIACRYCHPGALTDRHAGMPAAQTCMTCHQFVLAPSQAVKDEQWQAAREGRRVRRVVSDEMRKLLRAQGLDESLQRDPRLVPTTIEWVRVARLPDFAYFHHGAHARVGVECTECHGAVETFDQMRQDRRLTMGACVACHRTTNRQGINGQPVRASLDCVACHR